MTGREPLKDFPVCLQLEGRRVLVVGAGEVATRRVEALVWAGAVVTVVAPEASPSVRQLAERGRIAWRPRAYRHSDQRGTLAVFAATSDRKVNREVGIEATRRGRLVNACDDPAACTFTMPAVARRGALTLAISTGGVSPATAGRLRDQIAAGRAWLSTQPDRSRVTGNRIDPATGARSNLTRPSTDPNPDPRARARARARIPNANPNPNPIDLPALAPVGLLHPPRSRP